jgi:hypothetical protein
MGQEIAEDAFDEQHFARFRSHLEAEMELLRSWFAGNKFCVDKLQCGLELEAWLIDREGQPVPDNELFLATLDRQSVVPELAKFNFELNVTPQYISGVGLGDLQAELQATWGRCQQVAERLEHRTVSIGILPTLTDEQLCLQNMSRMRRYAALNEQMSRLRGGRPVTLEIEGHDTLRSVHHDLMLESAATSLQIHLKVPQHHAVRYYNASQIASAFTVAMAANAPLLFGKRLWDDTRIPVFEQSVDTAGQIPRVSFGNAYLQLSVLELFEENFNSHRVLLPAELEQGPSTMPYVRMHNGTIWRWNRPLIGFESDGTPHLRIEHRPMSASPSMADLVADMVLYLGLAHRLATLQTSPESMLPFDLARTNFYSAARYGLNATVSWIDGRQHRLGTLLLEELLPWIEAGLADLELSSQDIDSHVATLRGRLESGQTGAVWQRRKYELLCGDTRRLLLEYLSGQVSGEPIHQWS